MHFQSRLHSFKIYMIPEKSIIILVYNWFRLMLILSYQLRQQILQILHGKTRLDDVLRFLREIKSRWKKSSWGCFYEEVSQKSSSVIPPTFREGDEDNKYTLKATIMYQKLPTFENATLRRSRSTPSTGETLVSDGDPIKTWGQPT